MVERNSDFLPATVSLAGQSGAAVPDTAQALADAMPVTRWQKLRLVGLVILKRVRFLVILASVGLFINYWETIQNYWDKWTRPAIASVRELEPGQEFYCPMDPQVIRSTYESNGDVPKCPICGMPLSVRHKGEAAALPDGVTGRVQISPERIQLAGIKTAPVEYRPMVKQTKTVGYVTFDESRLSRVVSRVDGYVEKLYVDQTFTLVHKGDPLAEIYSPELYTAAEELILAKQDKGIVHLADSLRTKLLLLGVAAEDIDAIVASGKATPRMVIRSPQTGYVIDKKVVVGASVDMKMTLLEVADLSEVWVEADVYEKDIAFLKPGQKVEAAVDALPNRTFTGKLALVYPRLDTATRTNRVRFALENPRHELRPGMFATVLINTPLETIEPYKSLVADHGPMVLTAYAEAGDQAAHEFLAVPERAVIDSGSKKIVYVEREPGLFEGVEVQLGPRTGQYYPVLKGLSPGEKIAAAGGFLIDAETRLNPAAASTYFGASGGPQSSGHSTAPAAAGQRAPTESRASEPKVPEPNMPEPQVAVPSAADLKNIDQLPEADRQAARAQRVCPITRAALGSMGVPVKIMLGDRPVFLCCQGCVGKAKRNPDETLKTLETLAAVQK
jgi:Cu(I)/Ag(I) efflux system membrane fusion protein